MIHLCYAHSLSHFAGVATNRHAKLKFMVHAPQSKRQRFEMKLFCEYVDDVRGLVCLAILVTSSQNCYADTGLTNRTLRAKNAPTLKTSAVTYVVNNNAPFSRTLPQILNTSAGTHAIINKSVRSMKSVPNLYTCAKTCVPTNKTTRLKKRTPNVKTFRRTRCNSLQEVV